MKQPVPPKKSAPTKKAVRKSAPAKRTDKSGASGMGMTKSGVKAKAKDAGDKALYYASGKGLASFDEYSGRMTDKTIEAWADNDPTGSKAYKKSDKARNAVLSIYGMGKKK